MAENKGLGLTQTRPTFQMKGIVIGTSKDSFYKESKTRNNGEMRTVNFGIQVAKDSILYVTFNAFPQEFVYFSGKDKEKKNVTEKVKWADRYKFQKDGFRLMGINCGLEKTTDDKGHTVNDKRMLHPFDAAEYVAEHLKDGDSVFVKGTIEYGHYSKNNEISRTVKFIPNQISLCQDVDFDALDKNGKPYTVVADFDQPLVFQSIEKQEDGKFVLSAKIINYNSVEDTEFVVEDAKMATNLKKNMKPYYSIKMWGSIKTVRNTDTVEVAEDDGWGSSNPMQRQTSPYRVERVLIGADPASIDKETYSEDIIEAAIEQMKKNEKKEKSFDTQDDDWGSAGKGKPTEEEDQPW
jgi:hypothetical protein